MVCEWGENYSPYFEKKVTAEYSYLLTLIPILWHLKGQLC